VRTPTQPYPHQLGTLSETELRLHGYGDTIAKMYFRMPDYVHVLNEFVWTKLDLAPDFPVLFGFIEFWQREIDGPLHSVEFTHSKLIRPGTWRHVTHEFRIH